MKKKHCKCKRKVIIVSCNDTREKIRLTKTVRKSTKKVTLEVKHNTKITIVKENSEKYPIFKARSNERIVPCCLRPGCKSGFEYKEASKQHKQKRRNHTPEVYKKETHKVSYTTISSGKKYLNNESNSNLHYENISSDSLSSYFDEELETLIKSTRKRMRDSDEEWKLMPRHQKPYTSTPLSKRNKKISQSLENVNSPFNSLNTLVLEADDKECMWGHDINFSPIMSPENLPKQEPYEEELKLDPLFLSQELYNIDEIKKEYYEKSNIDKAIIKLENNDNNMDLPKVDISNFAIKQEFY
ncbi:unnamed protein product, partial [Brenthis ino]